MKTIACVGSKEDFRKVFNIYDKKYDKNIDTEYVSVSCERDCAGKRFDNVLMLTTPTKSNRYDLLYQDCIARCNKE